MTYLVSKGHEVVAKDETFEDHYPTCVFESVCYQVSKDGELTLGVIGQLQQVWKERCQHGRDSEGREVGQEDTQRYYELRKYQGI